MASQNSSTTGSSMYTRKQAWLAQKRDDREIQKRQKRKDETRRREEANERRRDKAVRDMSWAFKAAQAAIAVLCGYESARKHVFTSNVNFSRFATEVVKGNREKDMQDFFTVMASVNPGAARKPLTPDEIRPLLRILDGLETTWFDYSYDDTDYGCDSDCGHYAYQADQVLERLSFKDLLKLCSYLARHGYMDLDIEMCEYTFFAKSGFNYPEEQYVSVLRHTVDIIISAASPTGEEMNRVGSVLEWIEKLKSDQSGWWATNKLVVDMRAKGHEMMNERWNAAFRRFGEKRVSEKDEKEKELSEKELSEKEPSEKDQSAIIDESKGSLLEDGGKILIIDTVPSLERRVCVWRLLFCSLALLSAIHVMSWYLCSLFLY